MIVTAALNWWDELPEDLDRCVRGAAQIADRIVALDGAYARYPGATIRSPSDQIDAIHEAAKATGMGCLIIQPDRLWAGQVEKRCHLLAAASVQSDWIATLDADHVITAERDDIRLFLRKHSGDVVSVPYITPPNPDRPLSLSAVGSWHEEQMRAPQFIPHLWRASLNLQVERFHWWYTASKNGNRLWAWGGDGNFPAVPHQDMNRGYRILHRTMMRTPDQISRSRAFLNDRDKVVALTGQEDDVPGLPDPIFDDRPVPTL